jgi:hypothetical protein
VAWFFHFDFEMCFAPQSHALFQQLSFQKCFEPEVFAPIIRHVLPAAAACTFSTPQFPKVLCSGQFFFTISRRNVLRAIFDHPEPPNLRKTHCLATFLLFRAL